MFYSAARWLWGKCGALLPLLGLVAFAVKFTGVGDWTGSKCVLLFSTQPPRGKHGAVSPVLCFPTKAMRHREEGPLTATSSSRELPGPQRWGGRVLESPEEGKGSPENPGAACAYACKTHHHQAHFACCTPPTPANANPGCQLGECLLPIATAPGGECTSSWPA